MIQLTKEQELIIKKEIGRNRNMPKTMQEELHDHFCCVVEEKMKKNIYFETALQEAFEEISPNGLDEIHTETLFLLSPHKVSLMRKSVRINGLIFLITAPFGVYFKANHLPASNLIIFLSAACLILGFLPAFFINMYKAEISKHLSAKFKNLAGYLSLSLITIGFVMKLIRTDGAYIAFAIGFVLFCFGFVPFYYFKKSK